MDREKIAEELLRVARDLVSSNEGDFKEIIDGTYDDLPDWLKKAKSLVSGDKVYYEQYGIGKTKYSVSYHDGTSTHKDGSDFYHIALFSNKKAFARFIKDLKSQGYKES